MVRIDVFCKAFLLSKCLRSQIEDRFSTTLTRFKFQIEHVDVDLSFFSRPLGIIDKQCRVVVRMNDTDDIVLTDKDTDLHVAIERAADRVGQAVSNVLSRN